MVASAFCLAVVGGFSCAFAGSFLIDCAWLVEGFRFVALSLETLGVSGRLRRCLR